MPPRRSTARRAGPVSPVRVLLLVLTVVFVVEFAIMILLAATVAPASRNGLALSLLDGAVLVAILVPALWLLVVRPLRSLVDERGALLARALSSQEDERARLARDLHDGLGQVQTAVLLGLRSVIDAETLEAARERAGTVHAMAVEAIDTTRRLARGLSPAVLVDLGLAPALERLCADMATAADVEIVRRLDPGPTRLDAPTEMAAYRFVQEALTNAVRHAGAGRIEVEVRLDAERLELRVADDGRGIRSDRDDDGGASGGGLGLAGLRERIALHGGDLRVTSSPSTGTTLRASMPVSSGRA